MKNRVLIPLIALLWASGVLLGHVLRTPVVHAGGSDRFDKLYWQSDSMPVEFQVFHDKGSGQEIVCTSSNTHYDSLRCWPTGRVWK